MKNTFNLKNVAALFFCVVCAGCANSVYDKYYKDAHGLNGINQEKYSLPSSSDNRIIIRYVAACDESAKLKSAFINENAFSNKNFINDLKDRVYRSYDDRAAGSTYMAGALYQVIKDKYPNAQVLLQPVVRYKSRERYVEVDGSKFNISFSKNTDFPQHEYPGSVVFIDFEFNPSIGEPPVRVLSHNGILTRNFMQSFGRWLSLSFTVYTANALSDKTNGILATNYKHAFQNSFGVKDAPNFGELHPYAVDGGVTADQLAQLTHRKLPLRSNGVVLFNPNDSFVLDEDKLAIEPKKDELKKTLAEYRVLGSIADVIASGLSALDQDKANYYSSIPWVSFYDEDLADRMRRDRLAIGDDKKIKLLKMIESEEVSFLRAESDRQSEAVVFGEFGRNYRKVRQAENSYINELTSSHAQASNAALIAGLSTMQSQLSSYSMRGTGVSGAIGGLQRNINTLNSITANQSNMNNAMSGISAANAKFSAGMNAYQNQIYKFVSQNSGKTTEIKAGSLGELRYQFLMLYRGETKGF